jgi:hypothetical protein
MLPSFGMTGDGILNTNGLTAILNLKGAKEVVDGGLEFWFGVEKEENSNFKTQGKNEDMAVNAQDPLDRLRYDPKIATTTVVINELEKAQNKGRAAIKNFMQSLRRQANTTIKNGFNDLWWAATPGPDDPQSIPSLIPTSATSGSIGGITRSGNTYVQHGVHTGAIADVGSEDGIATLERLRLEFAVGFRTVDIIIMSQRKFSNLVGYLAANHRYRPQDKLAQLRIPGIELGDATLIYENTRTISDANTINNSRIYGIDSSSTFIKTLKDGDGVWGTKFERHGVKLNTFVPWKWFGNLVCLNPRANWIATNVTA